MKVVVSNVAFSDMGSFKNGPHWKTFAHTISTLEKPSPLLPRNELLPLPFLQMWQEIA